MIAERFKARVANATVRLTNGGPKNAQGILVPGGYILTAAHCLDWLGTGEIAAFGNRFIEDIKTRAGKEFKASVCAADPIADIAALDSCDEQEMSDDCEAFEEFAKSVLPVPLHPGIIQPQEYLPVYAFGSRGNWVEATATRSGFPGDPPGGIVFVQFNKRTIGGDSGGPIVDRFGRLVGLVSWQFEAKVDGKYHGIMPTPWTALPPWLLARIAAATK